MRRGLYRVHGVAGLPDDVRMEDDGIEMPLHEQIYRARGYRPAVDDLPWQEEYFRKQRSLESASGTGEAAEKAARETAREEFRARFRKP